MSTYPPRPPVSERAATAARSPLIAGIIGGLVVLLAGTLLIVTGVVGKEEKTTIVQSPVAGSTADGDEGQSLSANEIYKRDGPGVVFIRAEVTQQTDSPFGLPQEQRGTATGSGFVIDKDGHILTNAHVVEGASKVEVSFSDDKTVDARLLGSDTSTDVALLKVDSKNTDLKPLTLGDSSKLEVGDAVVAIGNPFGLDRTVTTGIISALQRQLEAPNGFSIRNVIQTDAAINPGNSGGPLLDSLGRVIGINSQIATGGGGGSVGIGFAVPVNTVKKVSAELKDKGKVDHAFLGITGVSITKSMSDNLNLPAESGVLIQQTSGPAEKAGVRGGDTQVSIGGADILLGGDVLSKVDGKQVKSMEDVIRVVDSKEPGDQVTLSLLRGKDERTVKATLGSRPANASSGFESPQTPQLSP
ncbi:MAG TPA: trypsin-like peptidase domain-containing protein [Solirubrobacterales bacterium]|nr:trypsin-like peptidase domain-containing protein [Solirubrobacterales bacterium]